MGSSVILPAPGQPRTGPDPGFVSAAIPNAVSFAFSNLAPPTSLYVQKDDVIQLVAVSNLFPETVTFRIRFLRLEVPLGGQPDQPRTIFPPQGVPVEGTIIVFEQQVNVTAARTITTVRVQLGEGFILSVDAVGANAITRGRTFARAEIFRGTVANQSFTQLFLTDYTDQLASISWPGSQQRHYLEGPGWLHSQQVANPAAGADWALTVPTNARMRVQSFTAQLLTSATVANRNVEVIVDDGANVYWRVSVPASVAAGTTQQLSATGSNQPTGVVTTDFSVLIPPGLLLLNGHRVRTLTTGIQAGDQWSNIWFGVEEWLDF